MWVPLVNIFFRCCSSSLSHAAAEGATVTRRSSHASWETWWCGRSPALLGGVGVGTLAGVIFHLAAHSRVVLALVQNSFHGRRQGKLEHEYLRSRGEDGMRVRDTACMRIHSPLHGLHAISFRFLLA